MLPYWKLEVDLKWGLCPISMSKANLRPLLSILHKYHGEPLKEGSAAQREQEKAN